MTRFVIHEGNGESVVPMLAGEKIIFRVKGPDGPEGT